MFFLCHVTGNLSHPSSSYDRHTHSVRCKYTTFRTDKVNSECWCFFRSERKRELVPRVLSWGGVSRCTLKVVQSTLRQHFGNNDDMSFSYRAAKSLQLQNRTLSSSSKWVICISQATAITSWNTLRVFTSWKRRDNNGKKWNKEGRHPSLAILPGDCKIS